MKSAAIISLPEDARIRDALNIIDNGAMQIALVIDKRGKLKGTVSDGDIRRGLLKNLTLDTHIEYIINKNPVVATALDSKQDIMRKCIENRLRQIPIVDDTGCVISVYELQDHMQPRSYMNHTVLMVGGLGSRLRPLTEHTPKPMLCVGNKPILQTIVEKIAEYGFTRITMCVNYKSDIIQNYFGDGSRWGVHIDYVVESQRMGTAGALSLLKKVPSEPFFVMNGDLLTNVNFENLLEYHLTHRAKATMCVREYDFQVPYGVVKLDGNTIASIEEKPVQRFFVSAGIYVFDPSVLDEIPDDTFYDMPNLFRKLIQSGQRTISFPIREYWLDIGRLDEYEKANNEYERMFAA